MTSFNEERLQDLLQIAFERSAGESKIDPGSPPNVSKICADLISDAYDSYAKEGLKRLSLDGITAVTIPIVTPSIISSMQLPLLSGLSVAFSLYWSPTTFTAPGFVPVNLIDPLKVASSATVISVAVTAMLLPPFPRSRNEAAVRLGSIMHKSTIGLSFLGIPLSGGPPVPVPIS